MLYSLLLLFLGIFSVIQSKADFSNLRTPSYEQLPPSVKLLVTPYAFTPLSAASNVFPQNHNENKQYVYYYSPTDVVLHKNHKSQDPHSKNKKREFPYRFKGYQRYPKKLTSLLTQTRPYTSYPKAPSIYMTPPAIRNSNMYSTLYKKPLAAIRPANQKYRNSKAKDEEIENEIDDEPRPNYERDHAHENKNEDEEEDESEESEETEDESEKSREEPKKDKQFELSPDGDRVEFQIQNHEGPQTYIFGYDTGDGENRQFRLEERLKDGTVKGHYGYYDARGKLRKINYVARPSEGYQEKHHESNS